MKQRFINIGKNILLVFLTLLMALLTVLIWVNSLSWEDIPVESGLGQLYIRMAYGSASVFGLRTEDVPAVYPIEIAVRADSHMLGAQNDTSSVDALHEQFQEQINLALNDKVSNLRLGEPSAYLEALRQDCIFFRYPNAIPLDLVFLWHSNTHINFTEIAAKSVLISENDEVWIRTENDELYFYKTDIDTKNWSEQLGDSIFQPCMFLLDEEKSLFPETLVFENRTQVYPCLEMSEPNYLDSNGVDSLQIVLEAFEYNTSVGNYMDDSTRVFVNNNSTLRISPNGEILFHATSLEGGMEAYQESEVTEEGEMSLRVSAAKAMLEQVQKSYTTEGDFFLCSVLEDAVTKRVQLRFQYMCNGLPVVGEQGDCASVEFYENTMVSAKIHARTFTESVQLRHLIPTEQFIEMASEKDINVMIGYFWQDQMLYPCRYFESAV